MTRHTFWSLSIGGIFIFVSLYGVNQTQVQRLLTVENLKNSQISLFISWWLTTLLSIITSFTGLVIYANFWKCDPIAQKSISKSDQILPYFVMKSLSSYPGLPGVIIAGIFSGALSTVSSFVNSLSAVTLEDYVKPYYKTKQLSQKSEVMISKFLALFYGLLCVALTYVADQMVGLLQASLTIFGVVGGPLLMLFTAGMCCRTCNSSGALSGFLVSLIIGFWIGFGNLLYGSKPIPLSQSTELCPNTTSNLTQYNVHLIETSFSFYNLSYMWFAAFTWSLGLCVALIVSKLTANQNQVKELLFTPLIRHRNEKNENRAFDPLAKVSIVEDVDDIQTHL